MNIRGLDQILAAFKGKLPVVKIGILGSSDGRSKGGSNAEIGMKHEFGIGVPRRSFLRQPIIENLDAYLLKSKAFDKETLAEVVRSHSVLPWLKKVGIVAESIVQDAFDTGGFGKWAPWSPGYSSNTGNLLVDTQQLRNSISSEVV